MSKAGEPFQWIVDHIDFDGEECLKRPFSTKEDGYGICWFKAKRYRAHRMMCAVAHGPAPTPSHEAAHSCGKGNHGCCNPRHLSWKTPKENQADRVAHGTAPRGSAHGAAKLTESDVLAMRAEYRPRVNGYAKVGRKFGVAPSVAARAILGQNWRHIGTE